MNFIEEIVRHVIRPEREVYDIRRLGDNNIYLKSNSRIKRIVRHDFQLKRRCKSKQGGEAQGSTAAR